MDWNMDCKWIKILQGLFACLFPLIFTWYMSLFFPEHAHMDVNIWTETPFPFSVHIFVYEMWGVSDYRERKFVFSIKTFRTNETLKQKAIDKISQNKILYNEMPLKTFPPHFCHLRKKHGIVRCLFVLESTLIRF